MDKKNAIEKLQKIRKSVTGMDLVIDDGYDGCDIAQNTSYSLSYRDLCDAETAAARVSIDGVSDDTLSALWRKAWPPHAECQLAEDKYTHLVTYIDLLLDHIAEGKADDD